MRIVLDKADSIFSKYVRELADNRCVRCGGTTGLQASHYFGRAKEGTRFDPDNVDCLCYGCHQYWGSTDREAYRAYKLKQLGENGFKLLQARAYGYHKKDRKLAYIVWSAAYKKLLQEKESQGKNRQ
jgi:hypothetical protein